MYIFGACMRWAQRRAAKYSMVDCQAKCCLTMPREDEQSPSPLLSPKTRAMAGSLHIPRKFVASQKIQHIKKR
jgi:hypothetical protein